MGRTVHEKVRKLMFKRSCPMCSQIDGCVIIVEKRSSRSAYDIFVKKDEVYYKVSTVPRPESLKKSKKRKRLFEEISNFVRKADNTHFFYTYHYIFGDEDKIWELYELLKKYTKRAELIKELLLS